MEVPLLHLTPKKLLQGNLYHLNYYDYKNKINLNLFSSRQIKLLAIMVIPSSQVLDHIYSFSSLLLTSVLFCFHSELFYIMLCFLEIVLNLVGYSSRAKM